MDWSQFNALMLRLLFLIADSVLKNRGASNVEAHVDIEPRWLRCCEQLWKAAGVRDLLMFYMRSTFYLYRQGRLEFEQERPRDSTAEGSDGAFPGTTTVVGGELLLSATLLPSLTTAETTAQTLTMKIVNFSLARLWGRENQGRKWRHN